MTKVQITRKQAVEIYDVMEDWNEHSECVIFEAQLVENKGLEKAARECFKRHLKDGQLTFENGLFRDGIQKRIDFEKEMSDYQGKTTFMVDREFKDRLKKDYYQ